MNYNFTDRVRKVLAMAREEAIRLQRELSNAPDNDRLNGSDPSPDESWADEDDWRR